MATRIVSAWAVIVALAFPLAAQQVLPSPITVIRGTDNKSFIDLNADQTSHPYGLRIIRESGGDNAIAGVVNYGSGGFDFHAVGPGPINFKTNGTTRFYFDGSTGHFVPGASRTYDLCTSLSPCRDTFSQRLLGEEVKLAWTGTNFGISWTIKAVPTGGGASRFTIEDNGPGNVLRIERTALGLASAFLNASFSPENDAARALGSDSLRWLSASVSGSITVGSISGGQNTFIESRKITTTNTGGTTLIMDGNVGQVYMNHVGGSFEAVGQSSSLVLGASGQLFPSFIEITGTQVLTGRQTGWGTMTGTATRTAFDTATVTTQQLAERVKALIDDLRTHGMIGN